MRPADDSDKIDGDGNSSDDELAWVSNRCKGIGQGTGKSSDSMKLSDYFPKVLSVEREVTEYSRIQLGTCVASDTGGTGPEDGPVAPSEGRRYSENRSTVSSR